MGNGVKDRWAYAIADELNMTIEHRDTKPVLNGSRTMDVDVGLRTFSVNARIVSALLNKTEHMVIVRVMGNLALLVLAYDGKVGTPAVDVHVLNLAKTDKIDQWLERNAPNSGDQAKKLLAKGIVKSFTKTGPGPWKKLA